ncbi:MAG: hypothetical protein O2779_03995, partial [Nanoarchaeota archaeon]|nr:hypothetical protein [Nanoarchaeota archaeon]
MKLRKAVKKIIALGTGATMIGATLGAGAFAADLSDYPQPFVKDGKFSGLLVVGDKAAAADVVGVSDIAVSLQFAATKSSGASKSTASVEGDVWRVGTSSKQFEMAENVDSKINGENLNNITTSIDEQELAGLADGEITTEKGNAGYNQYLNFGNLIKSTTKGSGYVQFLENDEDVAADFFYVRSSEEIARYSLEFKQSLKSDVEDSTGAKATAGLFLGDLEDETISILGQEYTIVKARRTAAAGSSVELTLMGGASKDSLEEGETKTYTLGGVDYEVTVTAITDTGTIYAKFSVNGESTRSLSDGETTTLSDGTQIGVTDLIPNEAGDVAADLVEFYIGADKLFLKDTKISDTVSSNSMEVGNEDIDDVAVIITGTDDNTTLNIDTIQLNVTADDDFYVAAGHKLSEYMDEPEALIGWDIMYSGMEDVESETIRIKTSGSDQYDLVFVDGDGNSATVPLAYTSGTTVLAQGDANDFLITNGSQVIEKNDYFIVSDVAQDDGERRTYALRYKGADKIQSGETSSVKFDNMGTGKRIQKTFSNVTGDSADAEIKLGGATFNVVGVTDQTANDFKIQVDLDGDGTTLTDTDIVAINTQAGLKIAIANQSVGVDSIVVTFSTPNTNHYDNVVPTN